MTATSRNHEGHEERRRASTKTPPRPLIGLAADSGTVPVVGRADGDVSGDSFETVLFVRYERRVTVRRERKRTGPTTTSHYFKFLENRVVRLGAFASMCAFVVGTVIHAFREALPSVGDHPVVAGVISGCLLGWIVMRWVTARNG